MWLSFIRNPIDKLYCWANNTYEKYTHWYWNKKPHVVECCICGEKLDSRRDKYSPEECGWISMRGGTRWICHQCDSHRDFKPYMDLIKIDEKLAWRDLTNEQIAALESSKNNILKKLLDKMNSKE